MAALVWPNFDLKPNFDTAVLTKLNGVTQKKKKKKKTQTCENDEAATEADNVLSA